MTRAAFSNETGGVTPEAFLSREQLTQLSKFDASMEGVLRTVSGQANMRLHHSQPGSETWAYLQGTNAVFYDPAEVIKRLENGEEKVLMGSIAHEGGHVAITVLKDVVPGQLWDEVGFPALLAVTEELPTDHVVRERAPGAGDWVDEMRLTMNREGDEKYAQAKERAQEQGKSLQPLSRLSQLHNLILYSHFGEMDRGYDPQVVALFREVLPKLREIERTLPSDGAAKREINRKQFDRFKIFYREIWPKVQALLKEDLEDEAKRQHEVKQKVEAIKKAYEDLSEEEKDLLRALALAFMKALENDLIKKLRGKFGTVTVPTHGESTHPEPAGEPSGPPAEGAGQVKNEDDVGSALEALNQKTPESGALSTYEQYYAEVREVEQALYRRLEALFARTQNPKVIPSRTGSRAYLPNVFKRAGARAAGATEVEEHVFEQREILTKRDYAFVIAVDGSSSMSDDSAIIEGEYIAIIPRKHDTLRGTIVLAETLNRLGIPNGEVVFGTGSRPGIPRGIFGKDVMVVKAIDESLNNTGREIMAQTLEAKGMRTPTAQGIDLASAELEKVHAAHKFILVLTDGVPDSMTIAQAAVWKARKKNQLTITIGLGEGTDAVTQISKCALPNQTMQGFAESLGNLLEDVIRHPQKYEELDPVEDVQPDVETI